MAEYETDITTMSRDQLLNELIYHGQRVAYHAIRMEERYTMGNKPGYHRDYRFEWMGEEIRYLARLHARLVEIGASEEMKDIRAIIAAEDQAHGA